MSPGPARSNRSGGVPPRPSRRSRRIQLDARWGDYECPDCGDALTRWEITSYGRRTFCSCNLRWTHITGDTYIQAERR